MHSPTGSPAAVPGPCAELPRHRAFPTASVSPPAGCPTRRRAGRRPGPRPARLRPSRRCAGVARLPRQPLGPHRARGHLVGAGRRSLGPGRCPAANSSPQGTGPSAALLSAVVSAHCTAALAHPSHGLLGRWGHFGMAPASGHTLGTSPALTRRSVRMHTGHKSLPFCEQPPCLRTLPLSAPRAGRSTIAPSRRVNANIALCQSDGARHRLVLSFSHENLVDSHFPLCFASRTTSLL